jgi:hypothetical protein
MISDMELRLSNRDYTGPALGALADGQIAARQCQQWCVPLSIHICKHSTHLLYKAVLIHEVWQCNLLTSLAPGKVTSLLSKDRAEQQHFHEQVQEHNALGW